MRLTAKRGRGEKVHLSLDGEYVLSTDLDYWLGLRIADGTELDEEAWASLSASILRRQAYRKAVECLSRRDYARQELKQKLWRQFDEDAAEEAVERLAQAGYLDEEKYARTLFAHLTENKLFSVRRARQEMLHRGVDRQAVDAVCDAAEIDPAQQIARLLQTKYRGKYAEEPGRRRTVAALQRMGYAYGDIRSALRRIDEEFEEDWD
ncbi:MAG: RecX family transcriptional regulator [Clostridiales bacterium]|nr:RecX family transcriptional regulator [Clostridiales bacterium]